MSSKPSPPHLVGWAVLIALSLVLPQLRSRADVVPVGPQFEIGGGSGPGIGPRDGGGFLVVWNTGPDLVGQGFDRNGSPEGEPYVFFTTTPGGPSGFEDAFAPSTARDGDGGFVVAWLQRSVYLGQFWTYVRGFIFDADGDVVENLDGNESGYLQHLSRPALVGRGAGQFIVSWHHFQYAGFPDTSEEGIFARRSGLGTTPFQVNTYTAGAQQLPRAAGAPGGPFLIVWQSDGQDGSGWGIFGQAFDADGNPAGSELALNQATLGDQRNPDLAAAPDGTFTAVWEDASSVPSRVTARRFQPDGTPLGDEFAVEPGGALDQRYPKVAHDGTGAFLVTWMERPTAEEMFAPRARGFLPGGEPDGPGIVVGGATSTIYYGTEVAGLDGGSFVVLWQDWTPSSTSVQARRFAASGELVSHWDFDDGTGSGAAADRRGTNDGTLVGMDPGTAWVPGRLGGALHFAGDPEHVAFGVGPTLEVTTGMTLAAWVRPDDDDGLQAAFARGTAGDDCSFLLYTAHDFNPADPDAPRAVLETSDGGTPLTVTANPAAPLTPGVWHHLAMTYSTADGTLRYYVDGALAGSGSDPQKRPIRITAHELFAGGKTNLDHFFRGAVDDAGLWHRALSAAEVAALWNGGAGRRVSGLPLQVFADGFETGDARAWGSVP